MKDMDMKEIMEMKYHKMRLKRNTLFKAFLINYVAVFVVWLISMTPFYSWAFGAFTAFPPEAADAYMMYMLGIWKIAGVILFLVPAFAIWWQMSSIKNWKK